MTEIVRQIGGRGCCRRSKKNDGSYAQQVGRFAHRDGRIFMVRKLTRARRRTNINVWAKRGRLLFLVADFYSQFLAFAQQSRMVHAPVSSQAPRHAALSPPSYTPRCPRHHTRRGRCHRSSICCRARGQEHSVGNFVVSVTVCHGLESRRLRFSCFQTRCTFLR